MYKNKNPIYKNDLSQFINMYTFNIQHLLTTKKINNDALTYKNARIQIKCFICIYKKEDTININEDKNENYTKKIYFDYLSTNINRDKYHKYIKIKNYLQI